MHNPHSSHRKARNLKPLRQRRRSISWKSRRSLATQQPLPFQPSKNSLGLHYRWWVKLEHRFKRKKKNDSRMVGVKNGHTSTLPHLTACMQAYTHSRTRTFINIGQFSWPWTHARQHIEEVVEDAGIAITNGTTLASISGSGCADTRMIAPIQWKNHTHTHTQVAHSRSHMHQQSWMST